MELHRLSFLHHVSDRHGSGLLVGPEEVPNEKISPLEMVPVLIDHDAQMEGAMGFRRWAPPSDSKTSWSRFKAERPPSS